MKWRHAAIGALLACCGGTAGAQAPLDLSGKSPGEIEGLQRRLTDGQCYSGAIDGRFSDALTRAIHNCPDQRPILRIETAMHVSMIRRIGTDTQCRIMATGSDDKTVRVWSMPEGRLLRTQRLPIGGGNAGKVFATAVSPDGKWIAAGGWDGGYDLFKNNGIYIFDAASGQSVRRIGAMENVINHLEFSPDGTRIAAALSSGRGIHVLDVASGREIIADRDYGGKDSYGVTFANDGGMFAVGDDGFVRRYSSDGRRLAKVATRGGKQPFSIAIDPTGKIIAVGLNDVPAVDLFDAADLRYRGPADVTGIKGGDVSSVGWSGDGQRLYAGGRSWGGGKRLRAFTPDGRRRGEDFTAIDSTLMSLTPCGNDVAFGAADPSLGLIRSNDAVTKFSRNATIDMRGKRDDAFAVSADGKRIRLGFGSGIARPALFDFATGTLSVGAEATPDLHGPDTKGLPLTDWENELNPKLGGRPIPLIDNETSRSVAVQADRSGFVLGAEYRLRTFDAAGKQRWSKEGPGIAYGVNLAKGGELVIVGYADGTVRWLRWRDGQELLALFVNKDTRAWVAWTPTGYYAASPGAEDMIGWHINRGWEQPADFFPASKFSDTFARPDIVERVLSTMDEAEAIRQANLSRPDRRGPVKAVTDILPPVVSILSPAEGSLASGEEVRIDYLVRSPSGLPVDGVEAVINGRPAGGERGLGRPGAGADGSGSVGACLRDTGGLGRSEGGLQGCRGSLSLRLPPGTSEVGLFARAGERAGDVVKVRVARAAAARGEELLKPKLYALVVGVSQYRNPDYALQFAAKDARDFSAALGNQKGGLYSDVTLKLVTDGDATRTGILDGLDWLTKEVTSRDVGLVYFAGHGVLDESNRFYLAAADTDMNRLRVTGVPRDDIQAALDVVAGKALLFLDACHSGAVAGRRGAVDINSVVNEFTRTERGVVMFTASTGKQVSQENAAWGNGAFTKAVIEGLGGPGVPGKADMLGTGKISASALDVYVSERVKQLTDGRQSPVMIRPSTVPDFTLAVVR